MPNRTLCAVLEEMRKSYETRNFSYMLGLIEELQTLGSRMEAALGDQDDIRRRSIKIKAKIKELNEKLAEQGLEPVSKWDY